MTERWYVVETQPCSEQRASFNLMKQGLVILLPTFVTRRSVRGCLVDVVLPLFPRYLLLQLSSSELKRERFSAIYSTRGVLRILGANPERPTPVPVVAMELLIERCANGPIEAPTLAIGALVRIINGPLSDNDNLNVGRIVGTASGRVLVLMRVLFGSERVYSLPETAVQLFSA